LTSALSFSINRIINGIENERNEIGSIKLRRNAPNQTINITRLASIPKDDLCGVCFILAI
jgi:hypothetical protein